MPFLEARDGTRLFFSDWGTGTPVVFAHAWALSSDQWAYQLPDLVTAGLRCIVYDRRGHGRSDRPGSGYDYDTLADDLANLVEHLDLRAMTLVGHSFGCGEIVRYLSRHGDGRVERIAFLAPILPYLPKTEDNPDGVDPAVLVESTMALQRDVPGWCAANATGFFGRSPVSAGMSEWVTRQIVDTPLPVLLATMKAYATDFRTELTELDLPMVVMHGDADASAPIEITGRKVAALLPQCKLFVYEGAGHGLYAADHERVNPDLLAFVQEA